MNITRTSITTASLICFVLASCASRPAAQVSSTKPDTMVYFIRVVDRQSRAPVNQAKVSIELKTDSKENWSGLTNDEGFFQFTWAANHHRIQAHISVQAPGFASFNQHGPLTPDKLIELQRETK